MINKLDTVEWSKTRFDEISIKLKTFLKQAGFKDSDVSYIPCSGLTGENLVKPATSTELIKWYDGPTLIQIIGNLLTCCTYELLDPKDPSDAILLKQILEGI